MKKINISNGDLFLPAIGLGTMGYGGYFSRNAEKNLFYTDLIHFAFDSGVRVIDTAEVYGNGLAEEIIGDLPASLKSDLFIMTKFSPENSSQDNIIKSLDQSLKRLKRDYVDVYQPHWPSVNFSTKSIIEALLELVDKEKIRHIGLSNFSYPDLIEINKLIKPKKIDFFQAEYSPLERTVENYILPEIINSKSVFVAYSPFGNGDIFKNNNVYKLNTIANKNKCTISQLILSWVIRSGNVIAIPKATSEQRISENMGALNISLNQEDLDFISNIFSLCIEFIDTALIDVLPESGRKVYCTLDEAMRNELNLTPGPLEISEEIKKNSGNLQKPIKIKKVAGTKRFVLVEGRVKYWGWIILYGYQKPIPSIIIN